jgi:hypothetical protein
MMEENKTADDHNKGSTNLSEVLRLQAVALARMSERMSDRQQVADPQPMPIPQRTRQEDHFPVLARDVALSEDSLPVLNTFRKFLEAERRRARRRVIWVSIVLGAGFMLVVGVVAWAGRERIAELKAEILAANGRASDARRKVAADLNQVAESAAATASSLKQDLRRNVLSSHSILSSNLNSQFLGRDAELEQVKEKLSAMEIENALLVSQLKELADTSRQLQENYAAWIQSASGRDSLEPAVVQSTTGTGLEVRNLPLLIRSPGQGRSVQLRVPMTP